MTFRISGQVPFEDVRKLLAEETRSHGGDLDETKVAAIIGVWAFERFGRHLLSCDSRGLEAPSEYCNCGLEWARQRLGIEESK